MKLGYSGSAHRVRQWQRLYSPIDSSEAIRLDSTDAVAFKNRAYAYLFNLNPNPERAVADFNNLIHLNPNDAIAFNGRGSAYYAMRDFDHAITDYDAAIRLDPNYAAALYWRGKVKQLRSDNSGGDVDIAAANRSENWQLVLAAARSRIIRSA